MVLRAMRLIRLVRTFRDQEAAGDLQTVDFMIASVRSIAVVLAYGEGRSFVGSVGESLANGKDLRLVLFVLLQGLGSTARFNNTSYKYCRNSSSSSFSFSFCFC